MPTDRPPTLDPVAARRWHALVQKPGAEGSAWLHEEVGRRMQERLDWIKLTPKVWLDWEPVRGGLLAHKLLAARYPDSRCLIVESLENNVSIAMKNIAKPWWNPARWTHPVQCHAKAPLGGAQMLWANMALHMSGDPQEMIAQWHRGLAVDGFLMFSCLGPDTLRELRSLYIELGWPPPAHEFTDMHDWGDMLVHAGFAEPVMDMERITLSFESPQRLLQELRGLGRNLHPARYAGLRGRTWLSQLHEGIRRSFCANQRFEITFEVIYGHAFKPPPRIRVASETVLSLDDMRLSLQDRKGLRGY